MNDKITCQICGAMIHAVQSHLKEAHPETSLEAYKAKFPDAAVLSKAAEEKLQKAALVKQQMAGSAAANVVAMPGAETKAIMHEVFGFGDVAAAKNAKGNPLFITMMGRVEGYEDLVPDIDPNYVHDIELTKTTLMAFEMDLTMLAWGHTGTGKTSNFEQVCAKTKRAFLRVQHSANTEESHIVGQWTVRDGETRFELGPLPVAMIHGLVYCADEYDFAMPSVVAVYQAVLEGKPLVIKEADHANRVIRPHKNFRFCATGNTNGMGDETGLYQGTLIQNAANYDRFAIVEEVKYMPKAHEVAIVMGQAGVAKKDAERLVDFATQCREAYVAGKIGSPPGPRTMINVGTIGMMKNDFKRGIALSYANKLTRTDKEVVLGLAQRIWG